MLYKAGQLLSLCMKSLGVTIQTKATELPGPEVLFIILYNAVLTFESVNETIESVNETILNEGYRVVFSCSIVCCAIQVNSNF